MMQVFLNDAIQNLSEAEKTTWYEKRDCEK